MSDRQEYIDKISAKLKEWDADIQKLEAKAETVQGDAKANYRQRIQDLRNKRKETNEKLDKIQDASEESWHELKEGFEKSWKTLKDSTSDALSKFK